MHRLSVLSLKNRALIALITLAVLAGGVFAMADLKRELIPSLEIPVAAVVSVQPGTSVEIMDQQVSAPIERAVSGVESLVQSTSTSSAGVSTVVLEMEYGTPVTEVTADVEHAVRQIENQLPEDLEPTVIAGSVADLPVIQLAVSAPVPPEQLAADVADSLTPRLRDIEGVRDVAVTGAPDQRITIDLDTEALVAAGLQPGAVASVLEDNGVAVPGGTITEDGTTYPVQAGEPITSVEGLASAPVGVDPAGEVVQLGDVAGVELGPGPETSYSRLNGEAALAVSITKTPAGNTVDISHEVQAVLDDVRPVLPEGAESAVVFDQAPFIEESIEGLATEGALGLAFAVLVIAVFLVSLSSTIVAAVSIPISLAVTFLLLLAGGDTLNILTLGALTISIGRIVDDSIVVIENIRRHLSYGEPKKEAIVTAVREVGTAITSATLASVAVFLPIAFTSGVVGELFRPFALTVTVAILASLAVALIIIPVLSYWFLSAPKGQGTEELRQEADRRERRTVLQRLYVPTLRGSLRHPVITLVLAAAVFGGTLALVPRMETNFLASPGQDTLTVTQSFEVGASLESQDERARQVEETLLDVDGVTAVQTTVGSGGGPEQAFVGSGATPTAQFAVSLDSERDGVELEQDVRAALSDLDGVGELEVSADMGAVGASTVDLVVQAEDGADLARATEDLRAAVAGLDEVGEVTSNLATEQPVLAVRVDDDAAALAGLTQGEVVAQVAAVTSPAPLGEVRIDDEPAPVYLFSQDAPTTVSEIEELPVPTDDGPVPLETLAEVTEDVQPASVTRQDGDRTATVQVTPGGQDLTAVNAALEATIDDLDLAPGVEVTVGGVSADQAEAFADLGVALLAAILIVYIVMVATFNSLLQPFILMVSVPFAATGALLALLLTGTPLGVAALVGVLMLVGIVVTNAIVLIDLVNQYRQRGMSLRDSVTEGARMRLRPIVMTAAATILALMPMALGLTGGGAFISQPLALVVIGGLISSTLLTLVLVPVLYTLVERGKLRGQERRRRRAERGGRRRTATA